MNNDIPDKDLFMMCKALNSKALSELPLDYHVRYCRRDELDIWKAIHFDDPEDAKEYYGFMTDFFSNVYQSQEELFFQKCLFVCDKNDVPVGTCFIWKSYGKINTIHWYKVVKSYEGQGIGRALMSLVMKNLQKDDYPVYLHTHPSSYRAIKLYSDFGFALLADPLIGFRQNDLEECLPVLEKYMPDKDFKNLQISNAPDYFLQVVKSSKTNEF